jgi:hypothetical protein
MQRALHLGLIVAALFGTGCGDSTGPLFMSIDYRLRCAYAGGCVNVVQRAIQTLDGDMGARLTCSAASQADGSVRVDASVRFPDGELAPYGIRFGNLTFRPDTGVLVGMPDVVVIDDGNEYVGQAGASGPTDVCRSTDPSMDCPQECRISNLMLTATDTGSLLSGSLYCEGLQLALDPVRERELTNSATQSEPAFFEIENCDGF